MGQFGEMPQVQRFRRFMGFLKKFGNTIGGAVNNVAQVATHPFADPKRTLIGLGTLGASEVGRSADNQFNLGLGSNAKAPQSTASIDTTGAENTARNNASIYYGSQADLGTDAADYRARVKAGLDQPSGLANRFINASNTDIAGLNRKAGMSGASTGARGIAARQDAISKQSEMQQQFNKENLNAYGRNISAGIQGTEGLAASAAGRAIASTPGYVPEAGGLLSGTKACGALLAIGLMSKETHASEALFLDKNSLDYIGYSLVCAPIVYMIYKNRLFAKLFSSIAHRYIEERLTNKISFTNKLFTKMFSIIGEVHGKFNEKKDVV